MRKVNIQFKGINRSTDISVCQDGECAELINARVINGGVSPVGRPILKRQFAENHSPVFIHETSKYKHVISYNSGNNILYHDYTIKNDKWDITQKQIAEAPNFISIDNIGNMLVINTSNGIEYAIWNGTKYDSLGYTPILPIIKFKPGRRTFAFVSGGGGYNLEAQYGRTTGEDGEKYKLKFEEFKIACQGAIAEAKAEIKSKGYLYEVAVVVYALRMFDGTYAFHSNPQVVMIREENEKSQIELWGDMSGGKPLENRKNVFPFARIYAYALEWEVHEIGTVKHWADIIQSVDIFVALKDKWALFNPRGVGENTIYPLQDIEDLGSLYQNLSNFYLLDSIAPGDLKRGLKNNGQISPKRNIEGDTPYLIDDTAPIITRGGRGDRGNGGYNGRRRGGEGSAVPESSYSGDKLNSLLQQERLGGDDFTHNKYYSDVLHIYNNRLHIAGTYTILFDGHGVDMLSEKRGLRTGAVYVEIMTEQGARVVKKEASGGGDDNALSPILTYPDSRATKMTISMNGQTKTYTLKPHPFLNTSFYQDPELNPIVVNGSDTPPSVNNSPIYNPTKIKVSKINNPVIFPVEQTYEVSSSKIIGIENIAANVSEGQFGQFPLYVFTMSGIYAMDVGISVAYSRIIPISNYACRNKKSICKSSKGIIFASDAHIYVLNGSRIEKISSPLEGYLPYSMGTDIMKKILAIPNLKASETEIQFFMEDCVCGYSYEDDEIIVSNPKYGYSYVYNLMSSNWHKLSFACDKFLNNYPGCWGVITKEPTIYDMHNPHRTVNNIAVITRPVKFGSSEHKRILHTALRGRVHKSESDIWMRGEPVKFRGEDVSIFKQIGYYVLGSNDGETFVFLSGKENIVDLRDLITKMNKTKAYKYFCFCLVGGVRTDVSLNYIEVMAETTLNNRLR